MTGLLGFSRLKAGDKYEVALRYGKGQKWKSNGQIVKKGYQLGKFSLRFLAILNSHWLIKNINYFLRTNMV